MAFGERLKKLRNDNKLTQQEMSDIININRSTLAGYESENKQPDFDTLNKIADFFKVSIDYLLGRTDTMNSESDGKIDDEVLGLARDFMLLDTNEKKVAKDFLKLLHERKRGQNDK